MRTTSGATLHLTAKWFHSCFGPYFFLPYPRHLAKSALCYDPRQFIRVMTMARKPKPAEQPKFPPSLNMTPGAPAPDETPEQRERREQHNARIARQKERRRKLSNSVH